MKQESVTIETYGVLALEHLSRVQKLNLKAMARIQKRMISDVKQGRSLFVFGSGHSALLSLELFHRAGGPAFLIPIVSESFLPSAGPRMVRFMEGSSSIAKVLLDRSGIQKNEMIWLISNSGINSAIVEMALECKKRGLHSIAFTSLPHSKKTDSRHPSGKKLYELCKEVIDLDCVLGDATIAVGKNLSVGPMSSLSGIFLMHSILSAATAELERQGMPCVYSSVNTSDGENRNLDLEKKAKLRDPLLR